MWTADGPSRSSIVAKYRVISIARAQKIFDLLRAVCICSAHGNTPYICSRALPLWRDMTAIVRCCLLAFDMPFTLLYVALAESSCRHTEAADSQLAILSSLRNPHVRLDMVVPLLAVAARKNTVAAQFISHKLHQSCLSWFMRA